MNTAVSILIPQQLNLELHVVLLRLSIGNLSCTHERFRETTALRTVCFFLTNNSVVVRYDIEVQRSGHLLTT